jgi:serine/threonine protein kinase/predicted ATPase
LDDHLSGATLDNRYRLHELVGKGGMGRVYRATQLAMDRQVAVKVLNPDLANDEVAVARFFREVRAGSRLNHPNIVTVYDFGRAEDNTIFMAMELLKGQPLNSYMADRQLTIRSSCQIMSAVCDALVPAHDSGIIHRDLKPGNIFILSDAEDIRVKVVDFGIAKIIETTDERDITRTGTICGTPGYMSPEQASGQELDPRSDLYSVGVILYELLTGVPPFTGNSPVEILVKHLNEPAQRLEELLGDGVVPVGLSDLIHRCLSKRPAQRPRSAEHLSRTLLDIIAIVHPDKTVASKRTQDGDATTMLESLTDWVAPSAQGGTSGQSLTPDFIRPGNLMLERYRILNEIGAGPCGRMYKAADTRNKESFVAVKILPDFNAEWKRETLIRLKEATRTLESSPEDRVLHWKEITIEDKLGVLVSDFCDGGSLAARLHRFGRLLWRDVVMLATDVCHGLSELHREQRQHLNLKPSNLLYREGRVCISDHGLSMFLDQDDLTLSNDPGSLLAYHSPEQAGMIARITDSRADLYALGTIMYECLTGEVPFSSPNPWQSQRNKVSRPPELPSGQAGEIPSSLEEVILKLLEPLPEDRYQSAEGVLADLVRVAQGDEGHLELGRDDSPLDLSVEGRLYGRDVEMADINHRAKRLATSNGCTLLISGRSGVGKSRLGREAAYRMRVQGGNLLQGRGHQFSARTPFGGLSEIFQVLGRSMRAQPGVVRDEQIRHILEACGSHAGIVTSLFPQLSQLLGSQPEPVALEAGAEKIRLHRVVGSALLALATPDSPLCLYIDDIQWLDDATSQFLNYFVPRISQHPVLMVLVANEDRLETIEDIWWADSEDRLVRMDISPLRERDVHAFMQERFGRDIPGLESLSTEMHRRSSGLPLMLRELLPALLQREVLTRTDGSWAVDLAALESLRPGDLGVELLRDRLDALPTDARQALAVAALFGSALKSAWLSAATQQSVEAVHHHLYLAEQQGFISVIRDETGFHYDFVDDRLRAACAGFLSSSDRRETHLRIAGLLPSLVHEDDKDVQQIAHHLVEGNAGDEAVEPLMEAAALSLRRFAPLLATHFAREALRRSGDDHPESISLRLILGKSSRLMGDMEEAVNELERVAARASDESVRISTYEELASCHRVQGNVQAALEAIDSALKLLRIPMPQTPFQQRLATLRLALRHLRRKQFSTSGSGIEARRFATASELLMLRGEILFFVDQSAGVHSALLALDYATRSDSQSQLAYTLSALSAVVGIGGGLIRKGLAWSQEALRLSRASDSRLLEARASVYNLMLSILSCKDENIDTIADETERLSREVGDHWLIAVALEGKGELEFLRGNLVAHHQLARQLRKEMLLAGETKQMVAWSYSISSWCANDMGMWEAALGLTGKTLEVAESIGDRLTAFLGRCNRLIALTQLNRFDDAYALASEVFGGAIPKVPKAYLSSGLRRACSGCIAAYRLTLEPRWRTLTGRLVRLNIRKSRPYPSRLTEAYLLKAEFLAAQGKLWRSRGVARRALRVSKTWKHTRDYRVGQILLLLAELSGGTLTRTGMKYISYAEKKLLRTNGPTVALLKLMAIKGTDYHPTTEELAVKEQLLQLAGISRDQQSVGSFSQAGTASDDSDRLRAARQHQSMSGALKALSDFAVSREERTVRALEYVLDLVAAERAALLILPPSEDESAAYNVFSSAGFRESPQRGPFAKCIETMVRQTMATGTPQMFSQEPTATSLGDAPIDFGTVNEALCLPVRGPQGAIIATMYIDNSRPTGLLAWSTVMLMDSIAPHFGEVIAAAQAPAPFAAVTQPGSTTDDDIVVQQRAIPGPLRDALPSSGLKRILSTVICTRFTADTGVVDPEQIHAVFERATISLEDIFARYGGGVVWGAFGIVGGLIPILEADSHHDHLWGLLRELRDFFKPGSGIPGLESMNVAVTAATGYVTLSLGQIDHNHVLMTSGKPPDRAFAALYKVPPGGVVVDQATGGYLKNVDSISVQTDADMVSLTKMYSVCECDQGEASKTTH